MNKPVSRLLATSVRQANSSGVTRLPIRSFSQTCCRRANESGPSTPPSASDILQQSSSSSSSWPPSPSSQKDAAAPRPTPSLRFLTDSLPSRAPSAGASSSLATLGSALSGLMGSGASNSSSSSGRNGQDDAAVGADKENWSKYEEPFHFHIYSHKHNTHVTVTKPDRNAIISVSAGQLGFRKAKRGTYDAAYQLTAYAIDKLNQGNWHRRIHKLEVVLRGFGSGREAATKVLLGNEGKFLRPKIVMVSDGTRLKFGGTRSKAPRRLG
jgi:small subunit ribosomal protein S11